MTTPPSSEAKARTNQITGIGLSPILNNPTPNGSIPSNRALEISSWYDMLFFTWTRIAEIF
jgi:hypothetical protein